MASHSLVLFFFSGLLLIWIFDCWLLLELLRWLILLWWLILLRSWILQILQILRVLQILQILQILMFLLPLFRSGQMKMRVDDHLYLPSVGLPISRRASSTSLLNPAGLVDEVRVLVVADFLDLMHQLVVHTLGLVVAEQ